MEYLELEGIGPTGLIGRLTAGIQGYVALGVLSSQPSLHASTSSRLFRAAAPLFQKPFSPDELGAGPARAPVPGDAPPNATDAGGCGRVPVAGEASARWPTSSMPRCMASAS